MADPGAELAKSENIAAVHHLLGCGCFSYVYCCNIHGRDEHVAVKVFMCKEALPGRGKEAKFFLGLHHPNLVNVLDFSIGEPEYVVLELCSGGSLQDVFYGGSNFWDTVPLHQRAGAVRDVARALDFLHQQDVLHRDVKSGNVFFSTPPVVGEALPPVKLGDFGFARPVDCSSMTQGVGTLRYMAPEVLMSGNYNTAADVFSLAILMHEILSGKMPYGKRNEASLVLAITEGIRPGLEELPQCEESHQLFEVLQACWGDDPDERASAGTAADGIESIIQNYT